ncbi:MAG: hypothetical protein IKQ45_03745 [Clostridia bacterium]|nr:hypothetical protein [Clostridia bacterium]
MNNLKGLGMMIDPKQIGADELLAMLLQEKDLEQLLQRCEPAFLNETFADFLNAWCSCHQVVPEHLIRRANLDKSFGHQLFSGKRRPSRDTVIQLAFAMGAGVAETQEMLKTARKSLLYPQIKRDAVLIFCLHNRRGLTDTGLILERLGLTVLGGRDR